jgi:hypothetical protein
MLFWRLGLIATSHKTVANQNHHTEKMMNTYYVATLAKYALVEAADESAARVAGHAALYDLYADVRERQGHEVPIEIRTVRLATAKEIEDLKWHQEMLVREAAYLAKLDRK